MRFLYIGLVIVLNINSLISQEQDSTFRGEENIELDTLYEYSTDSDSLKVKEKKDFGLFYMFKGKPGIAALWSLAVPGAGQIYNRKYWKAPIVIAAEATAIGIGIFYNRQFRSSQDYYVYLLQGNLALEGRPQNITSARSQRDYFRQIREYVWFGYGILHLVTIIDAFVDQHLLSFDVSEDLSIHSSVDYNLYFSEPQVSFGFKYTLK